MDPAEAPVEAVGEAVLLQGAQAIRPEAVTVASGQIGLGAVRHWRCGRVGSHGRRRTRSRRGWDGAHRCKARNRLLLCARRRGSTTTMTTSVFGRSSHLATWAQQVGTGSSRGRVACRCPRIRGRSAAEGRHCRRQNGKRRVSRSRRLPRIHPSIHLQAGACCTSRRKFTRLGPLCCRQALRRSETGG